MNNELLLLIEKHTNMLIEQTKTRPQETLEVKMNQQTQRFSFIPSKNLGEEGKRLLAETPFEATISVFNLTNENTSFSVSRPSH